MRVDRIPFFCVSKRTIPRRGGSTAKPSASIGAQRARSAEQSKCRSHFIFNENGDKRRIRAGCGLTASRFLRQQKNRTPKGWFDGEAEREHRSSASRLRTAHFAVSNRVSQSICRLPLRVRLAAPPALRGRLAKAKKNPARRAGFFEDWWSINA